eukprot:15475018-Alexandrium_andersonii.AAC.1
MLRPRLRLPKGGPIGWSSGAGRRQPSGPSPGPSQVASWAGWAPRPRADGYSMPALDVGQGLVGHR